MQTYRASLSSGRGTSLFTLDFGLSCDATCRAIRDTEPVCASVVGIEKDREAKVKRRVESIAFRRRWRDGAGSDSVLNPREEFDGIRSSLGTEEGIPCEVSCASDDRGRDNLICS